MTTDRPYREALGSDVALDELRHHAGTQFDPEVVLALVRVIEEGRAQVAATDQVRAVLLSAQARQSPASAT